jgi:DNA-binding NtrC family response regulator
VAGATDFNQPRLVARLDEGWTVATATWLPEGLRPWPGPCVLLVLEPGEDSDEDQEVLPVGAGEGVRAILERRAPELLVEGLPSGPAAPVEHDPSEEVGRELAELIEQTADEQPEERAAILMDWAMDRIGASRCALLPVEGGVPVAPLVFHQRGRPHGSGDARQVPRRVVTYVAQTRQALIAHDVHDVSNVLAAGGSVVAQRVRSYMAVPVVFRGQLIAVAYLDHLDTPRRFTTAEQAMFEAFAYELARPLLALLQEQARGEYRDLRDFLASRNGADAPMPVSPALKRVLERAHRLAPEYDTNLLILGETGSGKEWLARIVHEVSGRAGAFVPVNVSAISADLFEAELMGSVRGAFTGAVDRAGRIEEAEGGTLFLDEIGDLDAANQVKLLRFLQDRRVRRVGGNNERPADVRLIAATNKPRGSIVGEDSLREDLFQRFGPPLELPPLRRRREEILPLAQNWLAARSRHRGVSPPELDDSARELLLNHEWPGNVRQLQLVLSHALALGSGPAVTGPLLESLLSGGGDSDSWAGPPPDWDAYQTSRNARERAWLEAVMRDADGKAAVAARSVGCPLSTFRDLLKRSGLK